MRIIRWLGWLGLLSVIPMLASASDRLVKVTVVEAGDRGPVPCRIHLRDASGKPVRAPSRPFFNDHFVCPGTVELTLAAGKYELEIERGPEYELVRDEFTVADRDLEKQYALRRLANLAAEGWWSGELHVHRPVEDVELLMRAEDLHVAPVITWWNNRNLWMERPLPQDRFVKFDQNRFYHPLGGEDEREGGALLFFHLPSPIPIAGSGREYPSPMRFLEEAKLKPAVWVDIEKPFWWDVPIWLASGQCDSIGLANNHMCRSRMLANEAWGRPRDASRLPEPHGNGFWTQEIYYHILNTGLRIPPSAGSASGVLPNPVGYNRVYVHLGNELDYDRWWDGLRAGRSFVSNGPLLQCRANGRLPGHVFAGADGHALTVELEATLTSRDPISRLEIIRNGKVERAIAGAELAKGTMKLGPIEFRESGWFLVRVLAEEPRTFRFASTAPFYVEAGRAKNRISKESVQFFLDWARERRGRVKVEDASQRAEVLKYHQMAERFWLDRLATANAP